MIENTIIIVLVMGGMVVSFLVGARVYRAGRENYPVNLINHPRREKEQKIEEPWDNG